MRKLKSRHYFINAKEKKIEVRLEVVNLDLLQGYVNGYIEAVHPDSISPADVLYVDEEGLFKDYDYGFIIDGQRILGNGVIVGPDKNRRVVDSLTNLEDIKVVFFTIFKKDVRYDNKS